MFCPASHNHCDIKMTDADNESLPDRLRGIYHIPVDDGAGPLNGKDIYSRDFGDQGNLQRRAAIVIECLQNGETIDVDVIDEIVDELVVPDDPLGMGHTYVVPIRKEAAERIKHLWDELRPT
jgi:hypothetical protein